MHGRKLCKVIAVIKHVAVGVAAVVEVIEIEGEAPQLEPVSQADQEFAGFAIVFGLI